MTSQPGPAHPPAGSTAGARRRRAPAPGTRRPPPPASPISIPPHVLHVPVTEHAVAGHDHQQRRPHVDSVRSIVAGGERQPNVALRHVAVKERAVRACRLAVTGEERHGRDEPAEPHGGGVARAPGEEKRTFMWCARTAPADSPATRTLASSACLVGGWVGGGGHGYAVARGARGGRRPRRR
jgi:hypothetical protein